MPDTNKRGPRASILTTKRHDHAYSEESPQAGVQRVGESGELSCAPPTELSSPTAPTTSTPAARPWPPRSRSPCSRMDIDVVVPGHGPLTDKSGVAAVRDYLAFVSTPRRPPVRRRDGRVRRRSRDRRRDIGAGSDFAVGEAGRIAVNVETVCIPAMPSTDRRCCEAFSAIRRPTPWSRCGVTSSRSTASSTPTSSRRNSALPGV